MVSKALPTFCQIRSGLLFNPFNNTFVDKDVQVCNCSSSRNWMSRIGKTVIKITPKFNQNISDIVTDQHPSDGEVT